MGGMPRALTSRQRAARTRPRNAPCAGSRSSLEGRRRSQSIPSAGTRARSLLPPRSESRRARAAAVGGHSIACRRPARERKPTRDERTLDDPFARHGGDGSPNPSLRRPRGVEPTAHREATCSRRTKQRESRRQGPPRAGAWRRRRLPKESASTADSKWSAAVESCLEALTEVPSCDVAPARTPSREKKAFRARTSGKARREHESADSVCEERHCPTSKGNRCRCSLLRGNGPV